MAYAHSPGGIKRSSPHITLLYPWRPAPLRPGDINAVADELEVRSRDVSREDRPTLSHAKGESGRIMADTQEPQEFIIDALPLGAAVPMTSENLAASDWLRLEVRGLIREFLSVVPRSQPSMALVCPRPDGTPC